MSQLLTRLFLRRRYWGATAAIILCLTAAIGIAGYELNASRTRAPFVNALSSLVKAGQRFEVQVAWATSNASHGKTDQNVIKLLGEAFSDLVSLYTALCAAEDDNEKSAAHGGTDTSAPWHQLVHDAGLEIRVDDIAAQLNRRPMPPSLTRLWHSAQPPRRSLEALVGELILLGNDIVKAQGVYRPEHFARAEAIETLSGNELTAALENILRELSKSAARESTRAFFVLLGCCIAGIGVALLSALVVFTPMEQTILNAQKQLVEERDRALASERAKRDFLAVMSHELRTPMNGILGFTNLLLGTELSEKQKDYTETIHDSGEMLLTILNDILDVSRIEANAFELEAEDFSIVDVVNNVVTLLGPRAFAKRLDLSAFIDPSLPQKLSGDSGRLRQLLLNLVGNAIKFTISGAIAIEVRYLGRKQSGRHDVVLSVTDTGIGIPKEQQGEIFDCFTQVDTSASRKFEGTGLGLAICRKIAELMNGQICVESSPDRGSTFFVQIELGDVKPPADNIAAGLDVSVRGAHILVVDDNALNRRVFRLQLEAYGAIVTCQPNAHAAMMTLAQSDPVSAGFDLAIIDQMMPETDGIALRCMIRDDHRYDRMKLIISSSAGVGHDQQARALGFDGALPKPIMQDRLLRTIHNVLQRPAVTQTAEQSHEDAAPETAAVTPQSSKSRILLAEDNPANQRLIIAILESAGYSVDVVADGVEAVHAAQRLPYDLILMDIRMPTMGGIEAAQRIRTMNEQTAKCPIVAMTANAMAGDREEYLATGMTDYISKPVDLHVLVEKVRMYLGDASASQVSTGEHTDALPVPRAKAG